MRRSLRQPALAAAILVVATATTGCLGTIPVDPDGSLDSARGGVLHVGASPSGDLVVVDGDEVAGPLPDLVEGFASRIDADVEWTVDSEEDLVDGLVNGDLDIAVGGMTASTPWSDRAAVTRAYPGIPGSGGADVVMLLPMGENALLSDLERYLDGEVGG